MSSFQYDYNRIQEEIKNPDFRREIKLIQIKFNFEKNPMQVD